MKKNRVGSSLISVMVYLTLSVLVLALLMRAVTNIYPNLIGKGRYATSYLELCAAFDRMVQDLYAAPAEKSDWHALTNTELSWKVGDKTICWQLDKNRLIRIEGSYNKNNKRWGRKTKSIAGNSITHSSFQLHQSSSRLTGISISLGRSLNNQTITLGRRVVVRTGVTV